MRWVCVQVVMHVCRQGGFCSEELRCNVRDCVGFKVGFAVESRCNVHDCKERGVCGGLQYLSCSGICCLRCSGLQQLQGKLQGRHS